MRHERPRAPVLGGQSALVMEALTRSPEHSDSAAGGHRVDRVGGEEDLAARRRPRGLLEARDDLVRFGASERRLALRDAIPNLRRVCARSAGLNLAVGDWHLDRWL